MQLGATPSPMYLVREGTLSSIPSRVQQASKLLGTPRCDLSAQPGQVGHVARSYRMGLLDAVLRRLELYPRFWLRRLVAGSEQD